MRLAIARFCISVALVSILLLPTTTKSEILVLLPNGQIFEEKTLQAAAIDKNASRAKVIVTSGYTLEEDLKWPNDRELEITMSGKITINKGKTLTIEGPYTQGMYPAFYGDGKVIFKANTTGATQAVWGEHPNMVNNSVFTSKLFIDSSSNASPFGREQQSDGSDGGNLVLASSNLQPANCGGNADCPMQSYILSNWYYGGDPKGAGPYTDRAFKDGASPWILFSMHDSPSEGLNAGDIGFYTSPTMKKGQLLTDGWKRLLTIRQGGSVTGSVQGGKLSGNWAVGYTEPDASIDFNVGSNRNSGTNTAVQGYTIGMSVKNTGGDFGASHGARNVAIHTSPEYPQMGPDNYAIQSESQALSSFSGPLQLIPVTFDYMVGLMSPKAADALQAEIPLPCARIVDANQPDHVRWNPAGCAGTTVYCKDCTAATPVDNQCVKIDDSQGDGHLAVWTGKRWTCR